MTHQSRRIDPDKFLEANRDYIDRIEREGLFLVYDAALDTLFIEFGGPRAALSEHVVDNILLRIDPDTLHMVGVEIQDFFDDFLPQNRLFREAARDLGLKHGEDSRMTLMEAKFKPYREVIENLLPQLARSVAT